MIKEIKLLEDISQLVHGLFAVIMSREVRIKAIETWKNKTSLVGFKDALSLVDLKNVECIRCLGKYSGSSWEIFVHIRQDTGKPQVYKMHQCNGEVEAKQYISALANELPNVKIIQA